MVLLRGKCKAFKSADIYYKWTMIQNPQNNWDCHGKSNNSFIVLLQTHLQNSANMSTTSIAIQLMKKNNLHCHLAQQN